MAIRAKFECLEVKLSRSSDDIALGAVTNDSPENKQWSQWTPSGHLTLQIANPGARGFFKPGKIYFLDIIEAE